MDLDSGATDLAVVGPEGVHLLRCVMVPPYDRIAEFLPFL